MSNPSEYQLLVEIGRGDYTAVWAASRPAVDERVAVKRALDPFRHDADHLRRLRDCLHFLAGLPDYGHVLRPLDYVPDDGWLVLELMHGSLADCLQPHHP